MMLNTEETNRIIMVLYIDVIFNEGIKSYSTKVKCNGEDPLGSVVNKAVAKYLVSIDNSCVADTAAVNSL